MTVLQYLVNEKLNNNKNEIYFILENEMTAIFLKNLK